jgi:effector-binding domain-containing protein
MLTEFSGGPAGFATVAVAVGERRRAAGCCDFGNRLLASGDVAYEVRVEQVAPRRLAAIHANVSRQRLGAEIIALQHRVWPIVRRQGVVTGHNVVIYYAGDLETMTVDVGVEAAGFSASGEVNVVATPGGEVATTAHFGEYSDLIAAHEVLERWCASSGRRPGLRWEVYGAFDDDPAKRRTDVYFLLEA